MRIGFIGLGNMGAPMAHNLAKAGHTVLGFDTQNLTIERVDIVPTPRDCVAMAEVVITMLPNGKIVKEVLFGKQKNIINAKKGALIIDMSSSNPIDTINLGKKLSNMGFSIVDAPVSGGVKRAKNSSISIMIGGSKKNKLIAITILKKNW